MRPVARKSPVLNASMTSYCIAKEWIADILRDHKGSAVILISGDNTEAEK